MINSENGDVIALSQLLQNIKCQKLCLWEEKLELYRNRSSHRRCYVKKLKILQNSHESTCVRVSFLIKLQASGPRPATLLKERLWHRCFPVNFAKFLNRTPFLKNTSGRLLLYSSYQNKCLSHDVTISDRNWISWGFWRSEFCCLKSRYYGKK